MRANSQTRLNFKDIITRFENDIDLLKEKCEQEVDNPDPSDTTLSDINIERKFRLAMELNQPISYTINLPYTRYYKFRKKCIEEGYSIQEGFNKLVEGFNNGNLIIKEG